MIYYSTSEVVLPELPNGKNTKCFYCTSKGSHFVETYDAPPVVYTCGECCGGCVDEADCDYAPE